MYCSKCGNEIRETDQFCPKCGTMIQLLQPVVMQQPTDTNKSKKNTAIPVLIVTLCLQALCFVTMIALGDSMVAGWAFGGCIFLLPVVLVASIICIIKSIKMPEKKGKTIGIVFTVLSSVTILFFGFCVIYAETQDNKVLPIESSITYKNINNDKKEDVSTEEYTTVLTDWESFKCEYYGDLPIGLLTTPDATSDIVIKYINQKLGTNKAYEITRKHNAFHSFEIVIENELYLYDCTGIATFYFDWNETLFEINFEFNDDQITPSIMKAIHDDIERITGGKCSDNYFIEKGWDKTHNEFQKDSYCFCDWQKEIQENLRYNARLDSLFGKEKSISNEITFTRNSYINKTNYGANKNVSNGTDSITVDGIKISGKYCDGTNPYVSGTATNNSSKKVSYIKIKIALKNASGTVVDTTWTYAVGAEGLAPSETTQWKVYCSEAKDIEITVF